MGPRVLPNLIRVFWGYNPRQWALGFQQTNRGCFWVTNPPPMGLRVPPNTLGCFGVTNHRQWALRFRRKQSRCFGVTNTSPMGHQDLPNTTGLFWSYKSPANGPSGSAKRNRAVSHKKCLITYRQ
ncbi:Hypothetical protein FKW44_022714 [Caligus rogercresseyi]|uniref:Uncharacterized protein n=1 Tax=Caligus rogercresseyi TaxID=217165 RepID=A0A7T8GNA8_CALRO|nr:Hypothetical protein FKW44_022714 [Caligus rogercresseyi]